MTPHLAGTPVLTTDRLTLRAPAPGDWPAFHSFIRSDRARFVGGGPEFSVRDSWRAFAAVLGHWIMRGWGPFAACLTGDDRALALVGPWQIEPAPEPEISWTLLDPADGGRGVVEEAARRTVDHAFADLGWPTAVSYIDPDNHRSVRLAERLGAVLDTGAAQPDPDRPALVYRHGRVA